MVEPRGLTPNPLLANSAPWHREASAPHVSRQQATVESAAELHRCRTSLGYSSPGCPRPAKCRFEHPSAVPVLSGPWQHSSSVSQTRPLLQGVAATRRSTGRGPFAGIDALSTRKQSCHGPVDDIEALPRHGGSTATQRASTVTVRRPSEARLPGKGFPDLGHGSQGDTAPACRCLEDVGGQAAPNPDGHRGNPELAAEPIQLVLLRLTAVQPSAARTAERAVIVSSTSRTPVGIHTVPTLVTHVSEPMCHQGRHWTSWTAVIRSGQCLVHQRNVTLERPPCRPVRGPGVDPELGWRRGRELGQHLGGAAPLQAAEDQHVTRGGTAEGGPCGGRALPATSPTRQRVHSRLRPAGAQSGGLRGRLLLARVP